MPAKNAKASQNGASSLSGDDQRLVTELLANTTVRAAASSAGVSEATAYRRLSEEEFCGELQAAKFQVYGHALSRLQTAASEAAQTLIEIMTDKGAPESARIKAASVILSHAHETVHPPISSPKGQRLAMGDTSEIPIPGLR